MSTTTLRTAVGNVTLTALDSEHVYIRGKIVIRGIGYDYCSDLALTAKGKWKEASDSIIPEPSKAVKTIACTEILPAVVGYLMANPDFLC